MINSFIPATELEQPIRAHLWCYPLFICGWISLTLFFMIQSICRIVSIFVGWQCLKPTTILVLHSRVSHGRLLPQTKVALWNFRQGIKHFEVSKFKPLWKFTCSLSRTEISFLAVVKWDRETSWSNGNVSFIEIFHLCCGSFIITKNDSRGMLK